MKEFNKVKGDIGEFEAQKFLKDLGMKILETNYKNKIGEIDIVALDKNIIVFIEVKRRETLAFEDQLRLLITENSKKSRKQPKCILFLKRNLMPMFVLM